MKVLIAEDELMERLALKLILEKYYSNVIEEILIVENGEKAVETAKNFEPDIIFMDIKMPRLNGIEACKKIREFSTDTKIIIVTAFCDFTYAQQAIKNNVSDYLVKPYSVKSLKKTVDSILAKLAEDKRECIEKHNLQQTLGAQFLKNLMNRKTLEKDELDGYIDNLYLKDKSYCFAILMNKPELFIINVDNYSLVFSNYICYLLIDEDYKKIEEELKSKNIKYKSSIERVSKNVEKAFLSAINQLSEVSRESSGQLYEKVISTDVITEDKKKLEEDAKLAVNSYFIFYGISDDLYDNLQVLFMKIVQSLYKFKEVDAVEFSQNFNSNRKLKNDIYRLSEEFYNQLIQLYDSYHSGRKSKNEKLIDNTLLFIHENYKENIGMEIISSKMGVSKSYLTRVFTKHIKLTVMDYLLYYRMECAKKLLLEGMGISEISFEVGFSDPSYFSKSFKKNTGITPSFFLELHNNK
jgi:two-component system response regulator YesN